MISSHLPGKVKRSLKTEADIVRASFRAWDKNGDGLISKKEACIERERERDLAVATWLDECPAGRRPRVLTAAVRMHARSGAMMVQRDALRCCDESR